MESKNSNKVWFITGASRGFGRVWADAAPKRGDKVAARSLASIAELKEKYGTNVLTLELDVTKTEQVESAVAQAHAHFGRLDIVLKFDSLSDVHRAFGLPQSVPSTDQPD